MYIITDITQVSAILTLLVLFFEMMFLRTLFILCLLFISRLYWRDSLTIKFCVSDWYFHVELLPFYAQYLQYLLSTIFTICKQRCIICIRSWIITRIFHLVLIMMVLSVLSRLIVSTMFEYIPLWSRLSTLSSDCSYSVESVSQIFKARIHRFSQKSITRRCYNGI